MEKLKLKTVLYSLLFAGISMVGFNSCASSEETPDEQPEPEESILLGKWEVSDERAPFSSFEFTGDKKYIITQHLIALPVPESGLRAAKADGQQDYIIVSFGDYSAVHEGNTYTLELSEFGTITIEISGSSDATVTVNSETFTVNKAEPIDTSEKTELLCHTWNYTLSGEGADLLGSGSMTFTPAGTALDKSNESGAIGEAAWEWTKDGKIKTTSIEYTVTMSPDGNWEDDISILYWNVLKLTTSELILQEDDDNEIERFEIRAFR
ncbi:MAG: hypothetical protein LBL07_11920 [Tannerella sp.]|nr:hypothetical protein [Tannerella sp.]